MGSRKIMMPPTGIQTRVDGWVGTPDHIPPAIAELMAHAMPQPSEVEIIHARMLARHVEVCGDD